DLLQGTASGPAADLVSSMLSGPVDIDKLDYLMRDSLHCGVPYGRNFDVGRLISSLCVNSGGSGIALSNKGRTAAELLVFARYVMFSEVYWHHAVRSATAMFQRAFFELRGQLPIAEILKIADAGYAANGIGEVL
ncbi:MAG: metal-dependent phosphohydrolase, partial [Planctomycetota bacterium]